MVGTAAGIVVLLAVGIFSVILDSEAGTIAGAERDVYKRQSSGSSYKVRVKVTALNMRTGPGTGYKSRGKLKKGTYWITRTKNGWGRLKKNGCWIKLSYTTKVKPKTYKVRVKVTELNMRTGPGTRYKSKGAIPKGTYRITRTKNGWGKLKKNGYWIKLSYTKRV